MTCRRLFLLLTLLVPVLSGCYKNEPVPAAEFSYSGDNQFYVPSNVQFFNQSVNAFSWEWRFGDDSVSYDREPIHRYTKPGKYEVYLRAYTESRKQWASVIRVITIADTIH